jgi:hypothetical protein
VLTFIPLQFVACYLVGYELEPPEPHQNFHQKPEPHKNTASNAARIKKKEISLYINRAIKGICKNDLKLF